MRNSFVLYGLIGLAIFIFTPMTISDLAIETYYYFYLLLAFVIWCLFYHFFGGRFIRPNWKKPGKLTLYLIISWWLLAWIGHYALVFIILHPISGAMGHCFICKKYDINWRTCQPEKKYIALTERWAKGNSS
jgi:ABC-type transport system involved in multi-copper enzyme maturation permease subunit